MQWAQVFAFLHCYKYLSMSADGAGVCTPALPMLRQALPLSTIPASVIAIIIYIWLLSVSYQQAPKWWIFLNPLFFTRREL
jgi:hypothetical protein